METVHLDDFLDGGILREAVFREKVAAIDWAGYDGQRVLIKGCTDVPVPTWAYLMITARLAQYADHILYGEACAAIKLFNREKDGVARDGATKKSHPEPAFAPPKAVVEG